MTELLRIGGLVAGHDGVPVVHGVDLVVSSGELVALLGPNGAGKTTTMATVSGLLRPLGGSIDLFGATVRPTRRGRAAVAERARAGLAHVPEDRALFHELTVGENLALGAPRRARPATIARALELFPVLQPLLGRAAGLLSGGEQQMLAIARALASEPRLLMIDELSLGLAPLIVGELLAVLRRLVDEQDVGVLIVEQHVPLALAIADRATVLVGGHVVLAGPAADLARDPAVIASAYLGSTAVD